MRGDNTAALLKNLQPGTEYDIWVSARYRSGLGVALQGRGTTLEGKHDTFFRVALANELPNIKETQNNFILLDVQSLSSVYSL